MTSTVEKSYITCLLPFSYNKYTQEVFMTAIKKAGYTFFELLEVELENMYYGDIQLLHEEMDQYFLPYIEKRIFPKVEQRNDFLRYSRKHQERAQLNIHGRAFSFEVLSTDVVLCPFGMGFITVRMHLLEAYTLSEIIDFMHHFRIVEPKLPYEKGMEILTTQKKFMRVSDFILQHLCPIVLQFIEHDEVQNGYFGSLPYFEDERMLLTAYLECNTNELSAKDWYRISQLDGLNLDGTERISAQNERYIECYLQKHQTERLLPFFSQVITEHVLVGVAMKQTPVYVKENAQRMFMGIEYYQLLLHAFYKLTLLNLSYQYSELSIQKKRAQIEFLVEDINRFSSLYYFREVSSRSSGIEMSDRLRTTFKIESQFEDVKNTLESIYQNLERAADVRQNTLLFMLTMFTVISGIYGMNLVIDEWKGNYNWTNVKEYSYFEWICLITALGGISLSIALLIFYISAFIQQRFQTKKYKMKK